ncbi:UdgX family uracil-DNA binding protein [Jannaschia seohaensis]|uniref:Type-4 uracil-DNA glycosylase n=1 Tax=Jannaschia seohaensis TaxID=475081 RepID=A0A2Y9A8Z3_9RHOB|nr:UdgX family uracil-DNA binding protein [Jannaschia seohaensis]PWJ22389.1 DNA polymerase [Jannaschia seohaensis]SSA38667.1 DNA polymerase [Jannaschia seohaensis]
MFAPRLPRLGTEIAWRDAARRLAHVPPSEIDWGWEDAGASMFDAPLPEPRALTVPKPFAALARLLMAERTGRGFTLAHALLHRLPAERGLLANRADPQVAEAERIAKEIRRDLHKMHAFVRFREMPGQGARRRFAAWFEPDHRIEEAVADFFVNRFGDMDWAIVTPEVTIRYEGRRVDLAAVASTRPAEGDPLEELWTTYYSNIFNPARLKVDAMRAEMPQKYWRNLPEARAIPALIAGARGRVPAMQAAAPRPARPPAEAAQTVETRVARPDTLEALRMAARGCTLCPLHAQATQTVFGEGPPDAPVVIVGEQPGDTEDLAGRPFAGPAGQLFDAVAAEAGLDRSACYVTNAVKHFKFVQKGKRRLHQRPGTTEIRACAPWLERELALIDPRLVVAMGATALQALTGAGEGLLARRGTVERTRDGHPLLITVHPSYLLRLPNPAARARETDRFRADLARVSDLLVS